MRYTYLLLLIVAISSCSLSPKAISNQDSNQKHSSRRAHSAKYIIEQSHVTGSRHLFVQPDGNQCLNSSKAVSEYMNTHHRGRSRDAIFLILLDGKNQVLNMNELEADFLASPSIYTTAITQEAINMEAVSVILVQCLPSRSSTPYNNDREISKNIQTALQAINVELLDHLIIGRTKCYSFADNQLL